MFLAPVEVRPELRGPENCWGGRLQIVAECL